MRKLNHSQILEMYSVWEECDDNDKSTEYLIARLMEISGLECDEVCDFLVTHNKRFLKYCKQGMVLL